MVDQSSTVQPLASFSSNLLQLEQLLRHEDCGAQPGEALAVLYDLRRDLDQITTLYGAARRLGQNLALQDVLNILVDILWARQYSLVAILLGETELGPYVYHALRGVMDPLRFLGKQCPLPLWGELAHALVRRLDPAERDYLIISDLANSVRPQPAEFPWLQRVGSMMIVPLRIDHIAMGALILGRREANGFDGVASCAELTEIAGAAAIALYNAQVRHELQARAGQLVGLQLFTSSLPIAEPMCDLLAAVATGIADLLADVEVFVLILRKYLPDRVTGLPTLHLIMPWTNFGIFGSHLQADAAPLHTSLYRLVMWTIEAGEALFFDCQQEYVSPEDLYYNDVGQAMLVPLNSGEDALGAIFAITHDPSRQFDENDMVVVRTMANTAAAIIKLRLDVLQPAAII